MSLDSAFAAYLKMFHSGEGNAVSSRELETVFHIRSPDLRRCVNRLRSKSEPICSCEVGYYYAETVEEIEHTARQLRSRIAKIACAERGLSLAAEKHRDSGQLTLPMGGVDR